GGALAPRAAAFEHRLELLVANPGVLDWAKLTDDQLRLLLGEEMLELFARDPAAFDSRLAQMMEADSFLRWPSRALWWKHGPRTPSEPLQKLKAYDNPRIAGRIRARTLVMDGTADEWSQAKPLFKALRTHKDYMLFTPEDTGLLHVQTAALGVSTQRLF